MAVPRRDFIKAVGVAGVPAVSLPHAAGTPAGGTAVPRGTGDVDLYVRTETVKMSDNGTGTLTVWVGNHEPDPIEQKIVLCVVTPFFANFDHARLTPDFPVVFKDARASVPEILRHQLGAGVQAGKEVQVQVPLVLLPGAPSSLGGGCVIASFADRPATGPLSRITSRPYQVIQSAKNSAAPRASGEDNPVNLYFTYEVLALKPGKTGKLRVKVGNAGHNPTKAPAMFTFRSPCYLVIDRDHLPSGGELVHSNKDPAVPEVLTVPIPGDLEPDEVHDFDISITAVDEFEAGPRSAWGTVVPGGSDVDTDLTPTRNMMSILLLRA